MAAGERPTAPPPEALIKPLARMLRPLIRLLIRSGVTFPAIAEVLRGVFVDVALRDLLSEPKARTDSRISLLTGIHRKDVRRLRQSETVVDETPAAVAIGSQVIARWIGTPAYLDPNGEPLVLPRTAPEPAPSFEALVRSVTTDVRARAVLDNLVDLGALVLEADDTVRLNTAAFIPRQGREEQLFFFSRNLRDHIAAAVANVLSSGNAPFLDRSVHYDGLPAEAAAALEKIAREAAMATLVDVNRTALALAEEADAAAADQIGVQTRRRVNLGIYLYSEDDPAEG
jgi:hypothetical protein